MKKRNFIPEIKDLHKKIVEEIINLMVEHKVKEVDLLGSDCAHAFVVGVGDAGIMEVSKVYLEDGNLLLDVILDIDTEELAAQNENGDIGDAYQCYDANDFLHFMPCAGISDVYDTLYEYLGNGDDSPENNRDKKVFLVDKTYHRKEQVENLTEKDLEEWIAEEDYDDDYTIIKIDANDYKTPQEAIDNEFGWCDEDDYYIITFGF